LNRDTGRLPGSSQTAVASEGQGEPVFFIRRKKKRRGKRGRNVPFPGRVSGKASKKQQQDQWGNQKTRGNKVDVKTTSPS